MKKTIVPLFALLLFSCATTEFTGSSKSGYLKYPQFRISPEKAVELAGPWLDRTYELRIKNRLGGVQGEMQIFVVVRGDWYYIVKDNYPYMYVEAYRQHAVKVHVNTGEVVAPE